MVPPIQAPPSIICLSTGKVALITAGIAIIIIAVNTNDKPTARVNSSFLARQAEAAAIAADTPQTDMSEQITAFKRFDGMATIFCPNQYVISQTVGVTTQATKIPAVPIVIIFSNKILAPNRTKPVLM